MRLFRKIQLFFVLFIVLLGALWASFFLVVATQGPSWAVHHLKKVGIEATVGDVSTDFTKKVYFRKVKVTSPVEADIRSAVLVVRPFNIFLLKRAVITLEIYDPTITIDRTRPFPSLESGSSSKKVNLLPFTVLFKNGRVKVIEPDQVREFNQIRGETVAFLRTITTRIHVYWEGVGPFDSLINYKLDAAQSWLAQIKGENIPLEALQAHAPAFPQQWGFAGGADLFAQTKGQLKPQFKIDDWTANLQANELVFTMPKNGREFVVGGEATLSQEKIVFKSLKLFQGIVGQGTIRKPFSGSPVIKMDFKGKGFDVGPALRRMKFLAPTSPLSAVSDIDGSISGPLKNPTVNSRFSVVPLWGRMKVPRIEGTTEWKDGSLNLQASALEGEITASGPVLDPSQGPFVATVRSLSLRQWAKANGWDNVRGDFSSRLVWEKDPSSFELNGNFQLKGLEWGRSKRREEISGALEIRKDSVVMKTADNSLALDAVFGDSAFRLNEFHIDFSTTSYISAQGRSDLKGKDSVINVAAKGISPDIWPPLVGRYPDITGLLDLQGTITGNLSDPAYDLDCSFNNLVFVPGGRPWEGSAKIIGQKADLQIPNARVTGGYEAALNIQTLPSGTRVAAAVELKQADPQLLADLLKATKPFEGDLTGKAEVKFEGKNISGVSSVTWNAPLINDKRYDRLDMQVTFSPQRVHFEKLSLFDGSRAVHVQAEAEPRGEDWSYDGFVQLQHWGTGASFFDGELSASGLYSRRRQEVSGRLSTALLWWNEYQIDNLSLNYKTTPTQWTVDGKLMNGLGGKFRWDRTNNKISGLLDGKDIPIQDFFRTALGMAAEGSPKGLGDISASLKGTIQEPTASIKLKLKNGRWRGESFVADALVDLTRSTLTLTTAELNFADGGTVFAKGTRLFSNGEAHFNGTGEALPLKTLIHALGWPIRWNGRTDLTFDYASIDNVPSVSVTLDGEHTGFGPFKEGGALSGQIRGNMSEWDLSGLYTESGEGYIKLMSGSQLFIDKTGTGRMRFVTELRNMQSGPLNFFGTAEVTGQWKKKLQTPPGEEGEMSVELDVFARPLWINQFPFEGNVTHLSLKKGEVIFSPISGGLQQISGSLMYKDYPRMEVKNLTFTDDGVEKLYLTGLVGPKEWDFQLKTKDIDASIIRGLFDTTLPVSGPMDLNVRGKGSMQNPNIVATVQWRDGKFGVVPVDSAQCDIRFRNGVVRVQNIVAQKKKGYTLKGFVHMGYPSDHNDPTLPEIHLTIEKGDLAFLPELWPEIKRARGTFEGRLRVGPSREGRTISGFLNVDKIHLYSQHVPLLSQGQINLKFVKNRLEVTKASAKIGRGDVMLAGFVDFNQETPQYHLALKSTSKEGMSIRIPELAINPGPVLGRFSLLKNKLAGISRGDVHVDLSLVGPAVGAALTGMVQIENAVFTFPPSPNSEKPSPPSAVNRWWKNFFAGLNWNVKLLAGDRVWYQNELVDAKVTGALLFEGNSKDLRITGQIRSDQGSLVYSGNEFRLKSATLDIETRKLGFDEPSQLQTAIYLKAEAEKEVFYTDGISSSNQDTIVMAVDRALLGEIQPRFYSKNNPNLSQKRAFQLALGLSPEESVDGGNLLPDQRARTANDEETDKLLRTGLVQLLDSTLASPLARAIARRTGLVDFIRVTYQEKDRLAEDSPPGLEGSRSTANDITQNEFLRYAKGTKVKFGRGLSSRLFADYSFRVDEFQQKVDLRHEVELAYRVHRNLFLKGTTELDRERTLGRPPDRRAVLENQWRFGLPRPKKKVEVLVPPPSEQ